MGHKKPNKKLRKGRESYFKPIPDLYGKRIRELADRNRKPSPTEEAMQVATELCNPQAIDLVNLQKEWLQRKKQKRRKEHEDH